MMQVKLTLLKGYVAFICQYSTFLRPKRLR